MNFRQFDIMRITDVPDEGYYIEVPALNYKKLWENLDTGINGVLAGIDFLDSVMVTNNNQRLLQVFQHRGTIDKAAKLLTSSFWGTSGLNLNQVTVMANSKGDARICITRTYQEPVEEEAIAEEKGSL